MSRIIDLWDRITDDQIDQDDRQYTCPDGAAEERRDMVAMPNPENQQNPEQSENRARSACGETIGPVHITSHHAGNTGQDVKQYESRSAVKSFDLRTDNPQCVRIEEKVKQADVDEDRCHKSPVLAAIDQDVGLHAECQQS